jgi:hypothetical protein
MLTAARPTAAFPVMAAQSGRKRMKTTTELNAAIFEPAIAAANVPMGVGVDQSPALVARHGVSGVPTLLFIGRDGKIATSTVGLVPVEGLRLKLEALTTATVNKPDA